MTAFASCEKKADAVTAQVQIRSYNSRYLDIHIRIPNEYIAFEEKIKGLISKRLDRGRIEITLQASDNSDIAYMFDINLPKARGFHDVLVTLKNNFNIQSDISLDLFISTAGIIEPVKAEINIDARWDLFKDCILEALSGLETMREIEGGFIAEDFKKRLRFMENGIKKIEHESSNLISFYRNRLSERISFLTNGVVEIDTGRIAQESAILADKSDISEEIIRVRSHLNQFSIIMESGKPAGKKLNFLIQEFNREFNTIGSKAGDADLSHIVIDIKHELEKIREQVQNIE